MRILHLCLACFYIDGYNYQENVIPRINKADGHDVYVIASTETYIDNMNLGYVEPSKYYSPEGIKIKRLPYVTFFNHFVSSKIRKYKGLYCEIEKIDPDVIFCHDLSFASVKDVIKYKKKHPEVRLFADTHTAEYNSGTNWISMHLLHRGLYRSWIRKAIPYLEKYFYIGEAEKQFSIKHYSVPESVMEYYPLGGTVLKMDDYLERRNNTRQLIGASESDVIFLHSGKLSASKKTEELLRAFSRVDNDAFKMVVIGSVPEDRQAVLNELMKKDTRIVFLGWKTADELANYLCACDMYCQPGTVSATLQNAICYFSAIMSYPYDEYKKLDRGHFAWVTDEEDMVNVFSDISEGKIDLNAMKSRAEYCANTVLDYNSLAARIYVGSDK